MSAQRGQCPACRCSARLRKGGTVGAHHPGGGPDCRGTGGPPAPYDPDQCGGCLEYKYMTTGLAEACASVGIEHGKSPAEMLRSVLTAYHGNGHKEP